MSPECASQQHGATELNLEGVSGIDSELERIHIAEKNKAMAAKLKVCLYIYMYIYLDIYEVLK